MLGECSCEVGVLSYPAYKLYEPQNVPMPVADGLWTVDGPMVLFGPRRLRVPCPTRMTVIRLEEDGIALHSPIAFSDALSERLKPLGSIRCLIAPNSYHYLHIAAWAEQYPDADVWVARGLADRTQLPQRAVALAGPLPRPLATTLDCVEVDGGWKELVFLHRPSRTVIFTDLLQNFEPARVQGLLARALLHLFGATGRPPMASLEMRIEARRRGKCVEVERAFQVIRSWKPERMLIAHGTQVAGDTTAILDEALCWAD